MAGCAARSFIVRRSRNETLGWSVTEPAIVLAQACRSPLRQLAGSPTEPSSEGSAREASASPHSPHMLLGFFPTSP